MAILKTALIYFDQAVRDGSIRKASITLRITSSAVNRQLLQLEEEMGVELFVRLPRGIKPTAAGEALLAYIRRWQRDANLLREQVGHLKGGKRGTIRIAAAELLAEEVIPRAMARFAPLFPLVDFQLSSGDNLRMKAELLNKEADLVCAFNLTDHPRTTVAHSVPLPIGVITVPDHPLVRLPRVLLSDCVPYPVVAPGSDWLRHSMLRRLLEESDVPMRIIARTERLSPLKHLVREGIGIAFLARVGLERDIAAGRLAWTPLAERKIEPVSVMTLLPAGRLLENYMSSFVSILKEEVDSLAR